MAPLLIETFGGFGDDSLGPLVSTPGSRSGRSRAGSRDGDKALWSSRPGSKENSSTTFGGLAADDEHDSVDVVVKRARPQARLCWPSH